jgi:hypothetical protein
MFVFRCPRSSFEVHLAAPCETCWADRGRNFVFGGESNLCAWPSRAPTIGKLVFNGTHLITVSKAPRTGTTCEIQPTRSANPLEELPFTLLDVPADATSAGAATVDGTACTEWRADNVSFFVTATDELARRDAAADGGATVVRNDFFARGAYSRAVPADAFATPPECA